MADKLYKEYKIGKKRKKKSLDMGDKLSDNMLVLNSFFPSSSLFNS